MSDKPTDKPPPTIGEESEQPPDASAEGPQEAPASPSLKVVPPAKRTPPHGGDRRRKDVAITREKYDRALELYLHGTRSINGLARAMGIVRNTAKRLVDVGYPDKGWPALKDRAQLYDAERERAKQKLGRVSPQQADEMGRWVEMREENRNLARAVRAVGSRAVQRINEAVSRATSDRTIVVSKVVQIKGRGGKLIDRVVQEVVTAPPYLPHVVQAARAVAALVAQMGASEVMFARITVPDHLKGASTGWDKLTKEETDYIIANGGKLPPGITIDQLRQRV
jgi:hypothetical protein